MTIWQFLISFNCTLLSKVFKTLISKQKYTLVTSLKASLSPVTSDTFFTFREDVS